MSAHALLALSGTLFWLSFWTTSFFLDVRSLRP
jgi:hypothetical protein